MSDVSDDVTKGQEEIAAEQIIKQKDARINELTAFLYNLLEQYQDEFTSDANAFMNRSMIAKQIRNKLRMTPEMYELIHRSREQAEQSG